MKRPSISIDAATSQSLNLRFSWLAEPARYFAISGIALAVDFGGLLALTRWGGVPYHMAAGAAFIAGLVVAYLGSVAWVFSERACRNHQVEFAVFAAIGFAGLLINEGVLTICVEWMSITLPAAKLLSAGIVFTSNYFMRKELLFTRTPS